MSHRSSTLSSALVAMIVLSAVAVSAASAQEEKLHSSVSHTILDASAVNTQVFETTVDKIECTGFSASGTLNSATTEEVELSPTYTGCKAANLGINIHINFTQCSFRHTTKSAFGNRRSHIQCKNPKEEIHFNATFLGASLACITIPAQTPGGGLVFNNNGITVNIQKSLTNLEYTETGFCGSETVSNDGTYTGTVNISGTDTSGGAVSIFWK